MGAVEALTICFSGDMLLCETKERFLMNSANKQHFIKHLIATFRKMALKVSKHLEMQTASL